ncbi:hypothetical protein ACQCT6_00945 [Cytobacillus gottheilii]|uniref:hypothetical protein n=1 Tax=Cytobacillus gottheilii TaxID=859144 RepID=UPI003CF74A91
MNTHLMEILSREIIKSLPSRQKEIYEYVVNLEDELASQASTSDEFMSLLVKHSPHRQAAEHFNLSFGQLMMTMHKIEDTISMQLEQKMEHAQWLDLTEKVRMQNKNIGDHVKYFYFSLHEA